MARLHSDAQHYDGTTTRQRFRANFNTTLQSNGEPITIYDPNTTTLTGTNTYTRTPFPGDIIPANRMNPVGIKIASYIPAPNVPGRH